MGGLYDDLENYEDENVLSELRNENQKLKSKLEEYASTLEQLQKDFDKLSSDYKKLELNYSSLLKTARAEVERKSQLITNLNLEKDKLVIDAIQNRGRVNTRKITNGNKDVKGKHAAKEGDLAKEENKAVDPILIAKKASVNINERNSKHDMIQHSPNPNNYPDVKEKEHKPKISDHNKDKDKHKNENKKRKENHLEVASRGSKITNRRKSMPLLHRGELNGSDEDHQDDSRNCVRRKTPPKNMIDVKHYDISDRRNYPEKKVSENTRVSDKYGSKFESSRDLYHKSNIGRNKSRDARDKYISSHRSRRDHSPDRPYHIVQEDYHNRQRYSNDRSHWSDIRHRVLESPPLEKYNPHRRSRDSDRKRFDRHYYEEVYPIKHKIHDITEGPACKRLRSESLNQNVETQIIFQDNNIENQATPLSTPFEFPYLSLQSPDYVYLENTPPAHHIKEIMGTADTKLDDPRVISKKYVITPYKDKVLLSTVTGRDVHLKFIDTTTWNIDKDKEIPKMPTPLKEKPQISEDLVKDIYMGIDNPVSNLSFESGEIGLEEEEMDIENENKSIVTDYIEISTNKVMHDINQAQDQIYANKTEPTDTIENMKQDCSQTFSKIYRIPKISKPKTLLQDNDTKFNVRNKLNKKDITKQGQKKKTSRGKRDLDKKLQLEVQDYNPLKMFSDAIDVSKDKTNKFVDINQRKDFPEKVALTARDTVEGDLELSDETCDYTEIAGHLRRSNENENNIHSEQSNKPSTSKESTMKDLNIEQKKPEGTEISILKYGIETLCENKYSNISNKAHEIQSTESIPKTHKEDKTKDIKSRLCDLFGDTSSLITPDDLGIVVPSTTKDNLDQYAPLFDNTQDAVDLNYEEMGQTRTGSIELKLDIPVINNPPHSGTSEKIDNYIQKTTNEQKQTSKNSTKKSSLIKNIFDNINAKPSTEGDRTVKTVIISTGMQNTCNVVGPIHEEKLDKHSNLQNTVSDNAPHYSPLLSLTALATSTPHKSTQIEPSLSLPEVNCYSNRGVVTKDRNNVTSSDKNKNLDVPDVRIVVKRRRKPRGVSS